MVKSDVKFIVRILPSPKRDWECIKVEKNRKTIHIKRLQTSSLHPSRSLYWEFNTDGIITDSCQDVIYHKVTENTLNKVFKGVDMVVVAFGQSDTGKTYTTLGLEDGYNYRGIAPRILKDTLEIAEKYGPGMEFCVNLSFVEFDNNKCFNLLKSPPELVDSNKEHGASIKNLREGLALLFDGHKRRKFEREHNHCSPAVVTIHIKGIPVSGSSTSNIFSAIHVVDMPGTEEQYRNVRSDFCQADANLAKLALDKAKTWDNILAKHNAGCQVMGRCPSVFKSSNLIQYLGRSITNGVLRLVGHIRAEHHHLKNTLWTLKYGGRLSRKQPGEMLYTFSPDYKRLAQLLEEEVKQLKDEIVVSELLRGEYTQLNMCQGEVEHLDRLVKSYIDGRVTEAALLSAAKPNVILHSMKKLYASDLGDLKAAFNAQIRSAAEAMAREYEDKAPSHKKKSRHSQLVGSKDLSSSVVGLPARVNASVSGPTGTASSVTVSEMGKTNKTTSAGDIQKTSDQPVRTSTKPETAAKGRRNSKKLSSKSLKASQSKEVAEVKLENEEVEAGQKNREENWKEWESKNKEKADKLKQLKESFKNSTVENEKTVNEVSDLRNNLAALQSQLEEARWERMVNFGEHPGIDGARFVTSAAEQALEDGIKALKKEIYDKVTHMVNDHKEHMRKLDDLNNAQIAAEADFREYVESTKPPLVLFPPIEDLDLVPQNPTTSSFQEAENYGDTKSETEFEIVQSQRFHQKKFKPKKKWQ